MPLLEHIIQRIQNNTKAHIRLSNANLWDKDIDGLIDLFNQNKHIVSIDLSENNLSDEGIRKLVSLSHVRSLDLSRVIGLNNETAILLVRATHFKTLNLSRNRGITDVAGQEILLEASQTSLKVEQTSISSELQQKIAKRINQNKLKDSENTNKHESDSSQAKSQTNGSAFFTKTGEENGEEKKDAASLGVKTPTINIRSAKGG